VLKYLKRNKVRLLNMETDISPINDADLVPPPQHPLRGIPDDEEEDNTPIYLPHHQQMNQHHHHQQNYSQKTANLFEDLDKTAYIIIFIAFILGFFMGKTMQPVILRPN
jgi:hypothetical protein